jgi:hypothetical protein
VGLTSIGSDELQKSARNKDFKMNGFSSYSVHQWDLFGLLKLLGNSSIIFTFETRAEF